jgi:thiamine-monophosphate kinase
MLSEEIEKTGSINLDNCHIITGIGDDAALWHCKDQVQIATTDTLIQDTHFDFAYTGWWDIGYKAIAVNLSDIAAMGGTPLFALVSLSLPGHTDADQVLEAYRGMLRIAGTFGTRIIGGNIATSEKVVINVTAIGSLDNSTALMRSTARESDKIALTGYTGLSAAGRWIMKNRQSLNPADETIFKKAHLQPLPRVAEGKKLRGLGIKTAIDISDGLLADLSHICSASKVKAVVNKDLVPVHPSLKSCFSKEKYMQFILAGGEDYELLFTAPGHIIEQVKERMSSPVTVIGEIVSGTPGQVEIVDSDGKINTFEFNGWDHFKHE